MVNIPPQGSPLLLFKNNSPFQVRDVYYEATLFSKFVRYYVQPPLPPYPNYPLAFPSIYICNYLLIPITANYLQSPSSNLPPYITTRNFGASPS